MMNIQFRDVTGFNLMMTMVKENTCRNTQSDVVKPSWKSHGFMLRIENHRKSDEDHGGFGLFSSKSVPCPPG